SASYTHRCTKDPSWVPGPILPVVLVNSCTPFTESSTDCRPESGSTGLRDNNRIPISVPASVSVPRNCCIPVSLPQKLPNSQRSPTDKKASTKIGEACATSLT